MVSGPTTIDHSAVVCDFLPGQKETNMVGLVWTGPGRGSLEHQDDIQAAGLAATNYRLHLSKSEYFPTLLNLAYQHHHPGHTEIPF